MSDDLWHGLKREEWVRLFDQADWQERVTKTLRAIARCRSATSETRLKALNCLNEAIQYGALPADPTFPRLMVEVTLEVVDRGERFFGWFARRRCRVQLHACQWTLRTHGQFGDYNQPKLKSLEPEPKQTSAN